MKKVSKKLLISIVALLLISLSSFAMLSFTLADEENGEMEQSGNLVAAADSDDITQIDRIIDNSNNGTYGDKNYYIVEITSGEQSPMTDICANDIFSLQVLDGHKVIDQTMDSSKVNYISYQITAGMSEAMVDRIVEAVNNADMIYVHNDPSSMFTNSVDIPEALKLALASAATGDYKPFIIDSYVKTSNYNSNQQRTYNMLVSNDLVGGTAYSWTDGVDMVSFMNMSGAGASVFTKVRGNTQKANVWQHIMKDDDKNFYTVAKVLTIKKGANTTLTNQMKNGIDLTPITKPADLKDPNSFDITNTYVFDNGSDLYNNGYLQRQAYPDYIRFDVAEYNDLSAYDLSTYDFIVIEPEVNGAMISQADYQALQAAYAAKVRILYNSKLKGKSSSSTITPNDAPGYKYVLDKVATSDDTPRFDNVLVSSQGDMEYYATATRPRTVDDIANIIINGSYRGISSNNGGNGNANLYTVLEIEPCYPINTVLAKAFWDSQFYNETDKLYAYKTYTKTFMQATGRDKSVLDKYKDNAFYYIRSDGVKDASSDEITFDGGATPLSMFMDDNTGVYDYNLILAALNNAKTDNSLVSDYYNWTLTKAKIAHATGKEYSQVKVVHMSSAEFNSSRLSLADNYDAIYIGGDNSSIKLSQNWQNGGAYNVYFADGDTNTTVASSNGTYRSNDISNAKLKEIIKYSDTLPVIIDKNVAELRGVDPNSNMYKAITGVQSSSYCLYGFDSTKTLKIDNTSNDYGDTSFVTVFNGTKESVDYLGNDNTYATGSASHDFDEDALAEKLKNERPKLVFTSQPAAYKETDSSTWLTKDQFSWDYEVKGANDVTLTLYVDENANGQFEDTSEEIKGTASGKKGTLKPTASKWVGDDYFGPIYWKVVAKNNVTGAKSSITCLSKIKRTKQDKMKVKLLEIQPVIDKGDNVLESLYLCTECQHSRKLITNGNISAKGKYSKAAIEQISDSFEDYPNPPYVSGTSAGLLALTETSGGGGGDTPPGSATVNYWYNNWQKQGSTNINKGRTITFDDITSGTFGLRVNWYASDFDIRLQSGSNTKTIKPNQSAEIDVVGGKVSVTYVSEEASQATDKSGKYIVDYLSNDDQYYDYFEHGNVLGIHEHKFGIVKYDDHETRTQAKNGCNYEGLDNWNTNWFLDFENDYDVETTIWSIPEYQQWCADVNALYAGLSDTEVQTRKETFTQASTDYKKYYDCMVAVINGEYFGADSSISATTKAEFETYIKNKLKLGASFASNKLTYKTPTSNDDVTAMLQAFAQAGPACDKYLNDNFNTLTTHGKLAATKEQAEREINYLKDPNKKYDNKEYYYIYSMVTDSSEDYTNGFTPYFVVWRDAKILEQYLFHEYKDNELKGSVYYGEDSTSTNEGTFNLGNAFTCVALGAAEDFGGKDINELGCNTLLNYINDNGHVVLFHDALTVKGLKGGNGTETMTRILGDAFGQSKPSDSTSKKNGYSITQRSMQYGAKGHEDNNYYKSPNRFSYYDYETESNNQMMHGSHDVRDSITGNEGYGVTSDWANQINEGIITEYPFTIDSRLHISPTASSGFTANTDDSRMVVYYTIQAGTSGTKSSMYAANPNDGANNYFLYQFNNVTYTGAGHSIITGLGRNNNDERRLFINVILNSARMSTAGPDLTLHDIDSTYTVDADGTINDGRKNKIVRVASDSNEENSTGTDTEEYVMYITSVDEIPEFTFFPTAPSGISEIKIWYDLKINGDTEKAVYNPNGDRLIYDITSELEANNVINERLKKITTETGPKKLEGYTRTTITNPDGSTYDVVNTNLGLYADESDFVGKNNTAAYICVELTDGKGKTVTKTLRIEFKPDLLELN